MTKTPIQQAIEIIAAQKEPETTEQKHWLNRGLQEAINQLNKLLPAERASHEAALDAGMDYVNNRSEFHAGNTDRIIQPDFPTYWQQFEKVSNNDKTDVKNGSK